MQLDHTLGADVVAADPPGELVAPNDGLQPACYGSGVRERVRQPTRSADVVRARSDTTAASATIDWIEPGTRFSVDDMVWFSGKGERDLDAVLGEIDLVVTGPHASAAFPEEMRPYIDTRLTRRLQYDFTDVTTSPVARAWAAIDRHVLYIENPHPRAVRDANRARPDDIAAMLRDAFARLAAEPEGRPSLAGVDAIRPVTFGYLPVLRKPLDDHELASLVGALTEAMSGGVDAYESSRDRLIERVVEAKLRRLASIQPASMTPRDLRVATHLDVLSIHDTMNHTARPDGAICLARAPADRLPNIVALSNRGDADGEARADPDGQMLSAIDVPTMLGARLRSIGRAYRLAFDAWHADDVGFNRPYLGGHETQLAGPRLRSLEPLAVARDAGGALRRLRLAAWQNEFLREFLLGPGAVEVLMQPGDGWTMPPGDRVDWLAERLRHAHDLFRTFGSQLDPSAATP